MAHFNFANKTPNPSSICSPLDLFVLRFMAATLLPYGIDCDSGKEGQEEGQVAPPNKWVAQQVYAVVISREVLALVIKKYIHVIIIKLSFPFFFRCQFDTIVDDFNILMENNSNNNNNREFPTCPDVDGPLPWSGCVLSLLGLEACIAGEHDGVGLQEAGDKARREVVEAYVLNWKRGERNNFFFQAINRHMLKLLCVGCWTKVFRNIQLNNKSKTLLLIACKCFRYEITPAVIRRVCFGLKGALM